MSQLRRFRKISCKKKRNIRLGIIAVGFNTAQQTADALVVAAIESILKFFPYHIIVPKRIKVISIDIAIDLANLPYY